VMWENFKKATKELKENVPELKSTQMCIECPTHFNQMAFYQCAECSPWYHGLSDEEELEHPPAYSPVLEAV
jgi:hypothetical protein